MYSLPYQERKSSAFTLIELLISITILGILTTIVLGGFKSSQIRSRDAKRKSDLKQIANALEMFYSDKGFYPAYDSSRGKIQACPYNSDTGVGSDCEWGSGEFRETSGGNTRVTYFKSLPKDPSGLSYYYRQVSGGKGFQLYAHLENEKDPNCIDSNCSTAPLLPTGVMCSDFCNFAITSPNVTPKTDNLP